MKNSEIMLICTESHWKKFENHVIIVVNKNSNLEGGRLKFRDYLGGWCTVLVYVVIVALTKFMIIETKNGVLGYLRNVKNIVSVLLILLWICILYLLLWSSFR